MQFKTTSRSWKKRFALLPTQIGIEDKEKVLVWLECYETRYNGSTMERRKIGGQVVFEVPLFYGD